MSKGSRSSYLLPPTLYIGEYFPLSHPTVTNTTQTQETTWENAGQPPPEIYNPYKKPQPHNRSVVVGVREGCTGWGVHPTPGAPGRTGRGAHPAGRAGDPPADPAAAGACTGPPAHPAGVRASKRERAGVCPVPCPVPYLCPVPGVHHRNHPLPAQRGGDQHIST